MTLPRRILGFAPLLAALALFFAIAAATARAERPLPPSAIRTLHTASGHMDAGEYAKAAELLAPLADKDGPAQVTALLLLGNAQHMSGDIDKAARAYDRGLALEPDNVTLVQNLAATRAALNQYDRAAKLFLQLWQRTADLDTATLEKKDIDRVETVYNAASCLYHAGDYAGCRRAVAHARKALDDGATSRVRRVEVERLDIHACMALEQWDRAERLLLALLEATPDDAAMWRLLAQARLGAKKWTGAACALETSLALAGETAAEKKNEAVELRNLASMYQAANAPSLAAQVMETTGADPLDVTRRYARARSEHDALRTAAEAARAKGSGPACLLRGRLLLDFGRAKQGRTVLADCAAAHPDLAEAHLLLGFDAWDRADWAQAATHFRRATRAKSGSSANKAHRAIARQALAAVQELEDRLNAEPVAAASASN